MRILYYCPARFCDILELIETVVCQFFMKKVLGLQQSYLQSYSVHQVRKDGTFAFSFHLAGVGERYACRLRFRGPSARNHGSSVALDLAASQLRSRSVVAQAPIELRQLRRILSPIVGCIVEGASH